MLKNIDTKKIVDIAVKAGEIILEIYNTDDFWGDLGMMANRIDYARTIKVLISSPVRWVIYFAPGRRQLKLKLRMRRKNSQLESTGGRCTKSGNFTRSRKKLNLKSLQLVPWKPLLLVSSVPGGSA